MASPRTLYQKFSQYMSQRIILSANRSGFARNIKSQARAYRPSPRVRALAPTFCLVPVVHAVWGFGSKTEDATPAATQKTEDDVVIEQADGLFKENEILQLYDFLIKHKDCDNDEILWRLGRAACDKAKMATDTAARKQLMNEGLEIVKRALDINDNNFACHKWFAILLDYTAELEGTKQRLLNSYTCKEHFQRAVDLNPTDATSVHLLGYWCFSIADIGWYQRKLAATFFASPPESTFEEALLYFLQAEESEPNFYSMNQLMIGKAYLKLSDNENAKTYLMKAYQYPIVTVDDKQAHKEATELLKSIGVTLPE